MPISNCSRHLTSVFLINIRSLMGPNIHYIQSLILCGIEEFHMEMIITGPLAMYGFGRSDGVVLNKSILHLLQV